MNGCGHSRRRALGQWIMVALTAAALSACQLDQQVTPTPTRTPRPATPRPTATPVASRPIQGWQGQIYGYPPGAVYDDYFLHAADGRVYGLAGREDETARLIAELRGSGRTVWLTGTLYFDVSDAEGRRIVVSALRGEQPAAPTASPAPSPAVTPPPTPSPVVPPAPSPVVPPAPSPTATPAPSATPTPSARPQPATPTPSRTPAGAGGPNPTATPQPVVITDWKGEYFANVDLAGAPLVTRNDVTLSFDWGNGAAAPGAPADGFSARWSRTFYFPAGDYRFLAYADDAVRVRLDSFLLIDEWHTWRDQVYTNEFRNLGSGNHTITVEYADFGGLARVWMRWEPISAFAEWRAEYFNSLQPGSNRAVLRNDASISFDWGLSSPDPAVRSDEFSARWTRSLYLPPGVYRFWMRADDGMRAWLDERSLIDEWNDGVKELSAAPLSVTDGYHVLKVEYYDRAQQAEARFWWEVLEQRPGQQIPQ